jgi:hypothetical protein
MRTLFTLVLITGFLLNAHSQILIRGQVTSQDGSSLVGANLYIQGSFDGTVTDTAGRFILKVENSTHPILVCSYLGYEESLTALDGLRETKNLKIILKSKVTAMNDVVITAGTFGAADSKKAVILKPYDILTTASAIGDIYGALHTLPGNSLVGEDGGVFVRGGEGFESKTFIDGMLVHKPYTSRNPDLPARGRFSPLLFSGTMFSTGGFSAEYGQALSSALLLSTNGNFDQTQSSLSLLPFGGGISHTQAWKTGSVAVSADFYNMKPYYSVLKQDIDWVHPPVSGTGSFIFTSQMKDGGLLHLFIAGNSGTSALKLRSPGEPVIINQYELTNRDAYINLVYSRPLTQVWSLKSGISLTGDEEKIIPDLDKVRIVEKSIQCKSVFTRQANERFIFKTGIQYDAITYQLDYFNGTSGILNSPSFHTSLLSGFGEGEFKLAGKFSIRGGGRAEYSENNNQLLLAPRISAALKTSQAGQISAAWGIYQQLPETNILLIQRKLDNMQAQHYIINYQWIKHGRTFRTELYYKKYISLACYDTLYDPNPAHYNSAGTGYARGLELFWRDKESNRNIDYWISYSYLDTKRMYRDYPKSVRPPYFPAHTISVVYKELIPAIMTQISASWIGSSGRPYNDPNSSDFMGGRTNFFSELNLSVNYIILRKSTTVVIHTNVSNVLGQEHIYGYRYSGTPDAHGVYASLPVRPASKRFILIGVFISFNGNMKPS